MGCCFSKSQVKGDHDSPSDTVALYGRPPSKAKSSSRTKRRDSTNPCEGGNKGEPADFDLMCLDEIQTLSTSSKNSGAGAAPATSRKYASKYQEKRMNGITHWDQFPGSKRYLLASGGDSRSSTPPPAVPLQQSHVDCDDDPDLRRLYRRQQHYTAKPPPPAGLRPQQNPLVNTTRCPGSDSAQQRSYHNSYDAKLQDKLLRLRLGQPFTHVFGDGSRFSGICRSSATGFWVGRLDIPATSDRPASTYDGEWYNHSVRQGKGTLSMGDGFMYKGEWKDDKFNGNGFLKVCGGDTYRGQFEGNKMHGQGVYRYGADGSTHSGSWVKGQKHGYGVFAVAVIDPDEPLAASQMSGGVQRLTVFQHSGFWVHGVFAGEEQPPTTTEQPASQQATTTKTKKKVKVKKSSSKSQHHQEKTSSADAEAVPSAKEKQKEEEEVPLPVLRQVSTASLPFAVDDENNEGAQDGAYSLQRFSSTVFSRI